MNDLFYQITNSVCMHKHKSRMMHIKWRINKEFVCWIVVEIASAQGTLGHITITLMEKCIKFKKEGLKKPGLKGILIMIPIKAQSNSNRANSKTTLMINSLLRMFIWVQISRTSTLNHIRIQSILVRISSVG